MAPPEGCSSAVCPSLLSSSKVLFAMSLQDRTKDEMVAKFQSIADSCKDEAKRQFYLDGVTELKTMDDAVFSGAVNEINIWFSMTAESYKVPDVKNAWVRVPSTAGYVKPSDAMETPFVVSIADPAQKRHRIEVPLDASGTGIRRLTQYGAKNSFEWRVRDDGLLMVQPAYEKKHAEPEFTEYRGVDIGITDMLYVADGSCFGTFKECIDYYKNTVEPLLGQLSTMRNKKRQLKHYLKKHKNLPEDAKRAIRAKIDRLENALRRSKKAYRKLNVYKNMLRHMIRVAVDAYIASLGGNRGIVTVLEALDIREFNKSRKANGMLSIFARGQLFNTLTESLNWAGFTYKAVDPAYTSLP